jgi:hypothetical protein
MNNFRFSVSVWIFLYLVLKKSSGCKKVISILLSFITVNGALQFQPLNTGGTGISCVHHVNNSCGRGSCPGTQPVCHIPAEFFRLYQRCKWRRRCGWISSHAAATSSHTRRLFLHIPDLAGLQTFYLNRRRLVPLHRWQLSPPPTKPNRGLLFIVHFYFYGAKFQYF